MTRELVTTTRLTGPVGGRRSPVLRALTGAHTVRKLRWARNGVLAALLATALCCLLVSLQAHRVITTAARGGTEAIIEVDAARQALVEADAALLTNVHRGDIALTGPGSTYNDQITAANQSLVLAANDNIADAEARAQIQFAEGLLITYTSLVDHAFTDYPTGSDHTLGTVEFWYASDLLHQGPIQTLHKLHRTEQAAIDAKRRSLWLSPEKFWWILLAPVLALLGFIIRSSQLLWRGFRRLVSIRLALTLLLAIVAVVIVGWGTVRDEQRLAAEATGTLARHSDTVSAATAEADAAGAEELRTVLSSACRRCSGPIESISQIIKSDEKSPRHPARTTGGGQDAAVRRLAGTHHLEATNHAADPVTLSIVFVLLGVGLALAYTVCRPRLDEYRFQTS